jgi:hypothetical protein
MLGFMYDEHVVLRDSYRCTMSGDWFEPFERFVQQIARESPKGIYDTLDPATRSRFRDLQAFLEYSKRPNYDYTPGLKAWTGKFRIGNIDSFLSSFRMIIAEKVLRV